MSMKIELYIFSNSSTVRKIFIALSVSLEIGGKLYYCATSTSRLYLRYINILPLTPNCIHAQVSHFPNAFEILYKNFMSIWSKVGFALPKKSFKFL